MHKYNLFRGKVHAPSSTLATQKPNSPKIQTYRNIYTHLHMLRLGKSRNPFCPFLLILIGLSLRREKG